MLGTMGMKRMKGQFLREGLEKPPQNSCCLTGAWETNMFLPPDQVERTCLVNGSVYKPLWFRAQGMQPTEVSLLGTEQGEEGWKGADGEYLARRSQHPTLAHLWVFITSFWYYGLNCVPQNS